MARALREGNVGNLGAVADGTAVNISDLSDVYFHVHGTFVGTWVLEVSRDQGTTWAEWDTGTTPDTGIAMLPPCGRVRLNCTAWTSGTIKGSYGGSKRDL